METLRDWTSFGEDGKAASTELRYFSGAATYRTTLPIPSSLNFSTFQPFNFSTVQLAIGKLDSGLAHVFVNGKDCGVVWCAPWEADVTSALREGENEIEIRYTNNWFYSAVPRARTDPNRPWLMLPTIYSGPAVSDPLQPSGLIGPVILKLCNNK